MFPAKLRKPPPKRRDMACYICIIIHDPCQYTKGGGPDESKVLPLPAGRASAMISPRPWPGARVVRPGRARCFPVERRISALPGPYVYGLLCVLIRVPRHVRQGHGTGTKGVAYP